LDFSRLALIFSKKVRLGWLDLFLSEKVGFQLGVAGRIQFPAERLDFSWLDSFLAENVDLKLVGFNFQDESRFELFGYIVWFESLFPVGWIYFK
jgi:hypothetical protein